MLLHGKLKSATFLEVDIELISRKEAAKVLGVSLSTIVRIIQSNGLREYSNPEKTIHRLNKAEVYAYLGIKTGPKK